MKIGIIVYSYTGNTLSVAECLKTKLEENGNLVVLESIKAKDENPNLTKVELNVIPDARRFDQIVLAAPVRGFAVSPIMKAYLENCPCLDGKPIACFVTHAFPFPWLGGNSALKMMNKLVKAKHARVVSTGVVNWGSKKRESDIQKIVSEFADKNTWA
jgi:hypothetical protein